jgi:adenylosuccinate synthase
MSETKAKAIVVVGAQWGDEGKGKVVDYLAGSFDYIARYAGGHNAGHTVIIGEQRFILQLIPSGILRPGKHAVIGPGVVVDPAALVAEIENLGKAGVNVAGRLHLSNRAHVIFPYHRQLDRAAESARGAHKIGTTSRGIGPAYEDKMARRGLRVCDLVDGEALRRRIEFVLKEKGLICKAAFGEELETAGLLETYQGYAERVRGLVCDTTELLNRALDQGRSVLLEGAQGTMLDIDHGTYPYVTSSSATAGGACTGLGVPPARITDVVGVTKAYTTRVGSGPFPTEMPELEAQEVRDRGKEYGAVTGRPRRCGWLDLVVLRYAKMINGISSLVVTKLDVFDTQPEIQVCVGYKYKGKPLAEMPAEIEVLEKVTPEYKALPGWRSNTYGLREKEQLPQAAKDYMKFVADALSVEVGIVSTGPERDATIVCPGTKLAGWL